MGQPIRTTNSREKYKRRRRRKILRILFLISVVILAAVGIVFLASFLAHQMGGDEPASSAPPPTTTAAATTTTTTTTTTTASSAPVSGGTVGADAIDKAFFDDAAFIGDSRTQGLMMYTGLDNATFYATQGLMVDTYFTKEFVKQGDKKVTIPEALKSQQFGKIYVSLGINELGWAYSSVFIKKYGEVVDNLKSLQPGATIYVEAILPVTKKKSDGDKIYNNPKIDEYNALIEQMAREKGVRFLNSNEALGTDDGALPAEAATDGVHLTASYCKKWLAYIQAHS